MTSQRLLFIDFDGTLAEWGVVPDTHIDAIHAVQAQGHTVFLCTGRPISIVPQAVLDLVDGVVCSAGAYVQHRGEVIQDERFSPELGRKTIEALLAHQARFSLETPTGLYSTPGTVEHLRDDYHAGAPDKAQEMLNQLLDMITYPEDLTAESFAKVSVWVSPTSVAQIASEISPEVRALPNSITADGEHSGELQRADIDKADGMEVACAHLGATMAETIGFGDGHNDIGMLKAAGVAVGIEGSHPDVLAHADLIVPGPQDGGLWVAFRKLGLVADQA